MIIKPAQWGFDQGLVDPEWDWFWEPSNISSGIIWEGGGTPYDYAARRFTTFNSTPAWAISTPGRTLRLNAGSRNGECVVLPRATYGDLMGGLTEFTYAISFTFKGAISEAAEHSLGVGWAVRGATNSATNQVLVRYNSDTGIMDFFTTVGGDNLTADLDSVGVPLEGGGAQTWIWRMKGATKSTWQNGVQIATNSNGGTIGTEASESFEVFGGHNVTRVGNNIDSPVIDGHAWAFDQRAWSDAEIVQWSRNPFGPFEMQDDYAAWRSIAAGGNVLTRHYYDQMLAA